MTPFCSFLLSVLQRTNSGVTGELCRDKEVGKFVQSFDGTFYIGEVVALAIELSKEDERRRNFEAKDNGNDATSDCNEW